MLFRSLERASPDAPLHEADVTLIFVTSVAELAKGIESLAPAMPAVAALWVAWPKKASGVRTDMTEDRVRDIALPRGLVDNKVCAVDGTWSGLRLVVRKEHRADWPAAFVASAGRA